MRKHVLRAYLICMLVALGLFIALLFTERILVNGEPNEDSCTLVQDIEKIEYMQASMQVERFNIKLPVVDSKISHLIFYTVHQNVVVYCDGKAIYSMNPDYKNAYNESSGCIWVDIPLWKEYVGKTISVDLLPVYDSSKGREVDFYIGTRQGIYRKIIMEYGFQYAMVVLLFLIGISYCVFISRYQNNAEVDKGPAYIGFLAILISIWKFTDMSAIRILVPGNPGIALIPFAAITLMMVPGLMFFRNLCRNKEDKLWDIILLVCDIYIAAAILLQYLNIVDFRQFFTGNMVMIVISFVVCLTLIIKDVVKNGGSRQLYLHLACEAVCVVAILLDFGTYVWSGKARTSGYAIVFFLAYTIITGVIAWRQAISLAKEGQKTERFENQAYHDQLTGLYNRTALEKDIEEYMNSNERIIIVNFDLNDLKRCNDVLGHEKGDAYIKDSASFIQDCFGKLGNCYRSGGDEFHCLVIKDNLNACKGAIDTLREKCAQYNRTGTDIVMSIAIGYAVYDKRIDYNFADTMKRADKMMYQNKAEIKQMKGQNPSA